MSHGFLLIDKPSGPSSFHVVHTVKKLFGTKKVGHGGTLDPMAQGVLPIALGHATKMLPYLPCTQKTYVFTILFGQDKDTLDATGKTTSASNIRPEKEHILAILKLFCGTILQTPPNFSAIHLDGKRAYALARAEQSFVLPPRQTHIFDLSLESYIADPCQATLRVTASPGFYVRALARDMTQELGACGHVSYLRRTENGRFCEKDAISLEKMEQMTYSERASCLYKIHDALDDILATRITAEDLEHMRHGRGFVLPDILGEHWKEGLPVLALFAGETCGLGVVKQEHASFLFSPKRVFL